MKIHYYPETDSLYIDLSSKASTESQEIKEGLVLDFDKEGNITGVDIQNASLKLDLSTLEITSFPMGKTKIAS